MRLQAIESTAESKKRQPDTDEEVEEKKKSRRSGVDTMSWLAEKKTESDAQLK